MIWNRNIGFKIIQVNKTVNKIVRMEFWVQPTYYLRVDRPS